MLVGRIGADLPAAVAISQFRICPAAVQFDADALPLAKRCLKTDPRAIFTSRKTAAIPALKTDGLKRDAGIACNTQFGASGNLGHNIVGGLPLIVDQFAVGIEQQGQLVAYFQPDTA